MSRPAYRRLAWLVVSLLMATGFIGKSARAQVPPIAFPVENFRPAASARAFWVTESGTLQEHLSPSAQVIGNYARSPLRLIDTETDDEMDIIEYRVNLDVTFSMGFFNYLELGLALPATVTQKGEDLEMLDRDAGDTLAGGFGDIRVVPKLRILTTKNKVTTLALALPFSLPTGSDENMLGDEFLTFSPTAILSFETSGIDIAANLGFRLRRDQAIPFSTKQDQISVGNDFLASLGTKIHLWKDHMDLVGDAWFSTSVEEQNREELPLEALGGFRFYFGNGMLAGIGGGGGLTQGIGAPAWRVVARLGYEYVEDADPDHDGILYDADKCRLVPEDKDDFEDEDGCPDLDDDKDGIPDLDDECPMDPEDKDGYVDNDGCPDPDNDEDEIPDTTDKCPNKAEDKDTFQDEDGCPDYDNDGDGLADRIDKCPHRPEDKDTFKDDDGCPDEDNDEDRIIDVEDKCPMEAEDLDSFEDKDGCPDVDNDGDTILDVNDQCPLQAEVMNGVKDEDGCPDQKGPVNIEHGKINAPPVYFATGKDRILKKSHATLQLVAQAFKENAWVKKVRVEGHTDSRGRDSFNLRLSDRRANSVMRFLVQAGVDPGRLEAQGFGETMPIESNKTKDGRAANRRVEFVIIDPPISQTKAGTAPTAAPAKEFR